MGWRKGKALGLNEDGHKEHVKVFTKSDRKGWLKVYLQEQSSDCMCINSVVRKCMLLVFFVVFVFENSKYYQYCTVIRFICFTDTMLW